jgi:hypothetical protein
MPQSSGLIQEQIQNIGVVNADPKDWVATLRQRYGNDVFEVHIRMSQFTNRSVGAQWWLQMMHNRYCIGVSGRTSPVKNTTFKSISDEDILSNLRNPGGPREL